MHRVVPLGQRIYINVQISAVIADRAMKFGIWNLIKCTKVGYMFFLEVTRSYSPETKKPILNYVFFLDVAYILLELCTRVLMLNFNVIKTGINS